MNWEQETYQLPQNYDKLFVTIRKNLEKTRKKHGVQMYIAHSSSDCVICSWTFSTAVYISHLFNFCSTV